MLTLAEFPLHEARVSLDAIRQNARVLAARAHGALLADVAGDGYGHGAVESAVAAIEGGAVWLGVSDEPDAALLRQAGIRAPLAVAYDSAPIPADLVPAGAALYGLVADPELVPAMRVSGRVVGTKTIAAGEGVSYGHTYRSVARTNLALVALGYADGVSRSASNIGTLMLGGRPRLIAGRIAMNVLMLELGDDIVELGDEAVLFGAEGEPRAADWASSIGIPAAEASSALGAALPRSYS